jgi:integrase
MTLLKRLRDMGLDGKATVHGFGSSFKDWCADIGVRDEVSESALAHADRNAVRAAYRRTNYLEERQVLMQRWAVHCCGFPQTI